MLIKFFAKGQGGGAGPVDYLLAEEVLAYDENRNVVRDENGLAIMKTRDPLPEVIAGNPEITRELINSSVHKWSYRAGVIAFASEDHPSEDQQREVMDAFERLAFAGLERDQFDILWVRHEHEGNIELHFCTPRMELTTGKSLNIAPPGYQKAFDTLRDHLNKAYHWADPMEPERKREVKNVIESAERGESREALHEWVMGKITQGTITDRSSMVTAFEEIGFEINRRSKETISVKDPETQQKFKLRGEIFNESWTREQFEKTLTNADERGERQKRRLDQWGDGELLERFAEAIAKRADYNRSRYQRDYAIREIEALEMGGAEVDATRLVDRLLPDERDHHHGAEPLVDGQERRDDKVREDGSLLEQRGGEAADHHRHGEHKDHDMQSLWSRLLLPEGEGGIDVTHAFGEGVARTCKAADRSVRSLSESMERARGWLEERASGNSRIVHEISQLAEHSHRLLHKCSEWLGNIGERIRITQNERQGVEESRGEIERSTSRLENTHENVFEL